MTDRRELKRRYKESRRPMGVFRVLNTANGKSLVSSSVDLPSIFNRLRMQLRTGGYLMHPQLQRDWQELGPDAFSFEVLEELEPSDAPGWDPTDDLKAMEELWLDELQPYGERGYHRRPKEG